MRAVQYLFIAVIIAAGILGVICALEYMPIGQTILPAWVTGWLPPLGSAAAGWLIFAIVATLVVAPLAVAAIHRAIERRSPTA